MTATQPPLDGLNLLDGGWYADDPHEVWSWMRRESPVYCDDAGRRVGHRPLRRRARPSRRTRATFSSRRAPRPHGQSLPMMISMDDPDHHRRRSLVNRGFTPRRDRRARGHGRRPVPPDRRPGVRAGRVRLRVGRRRAAAAAGDRRPARLRRGHVRRPAALVRRPAAGHDARAVAGDRRCWATRRCSGSASCSSRVIAERRAEPRDDLISTLCAAEVDGPPPRRRVDRERDAAAAHRRRRDHPPRDQRRDARAPRAPRPARGCSGPILRLMPTGVEELLRWVSPIKNMARTVTTDVELRGQHLREGDQLILFYPSANRDEDVFERPDELDVRRDPNPHMAFGFGPHFCLGRVARPPRAEGHVPGGAAAPARPRARDRRAARRTGRRTSSAGRRPCRCGSRRRPSVPDAARHARRCSSASGCVSRKPRAGDGTSRSGTFHVADVQQRHLVEEDACRLAEVTDADSRSSSNRWSLTPSCPRCSGSNTVSTRGDHRDSGHARRMP